MLNKFVSKKSLLIILNVAVFLFELLTIRGIKLFGK